MIFKFIRYRINFFVLFLCVFVLAACGERNSAAVEEVNVYSARQPGLVNPIFTAFTEKTGIKVNSLFMPNGVLERLKNEGEYSPADMAVVADIGNLADLSEAGVARQIDSAVIEKRVPAALRDEKKDEWFGVTRRVRIIAYSKERIDPKEIDGYGDLTDPKYKGRVCSRPGTHPYMTSLTAAMLADKGEAATKKFLTGLKDNLYAAPTGSDTDQIKSIAAGDCDLALVNHYYYGKMTEGQNADFIKKRVGLIAPSAENGGAYGNISGAIITKHAPNAENARKLAEFLVSEEAQALFSSLDYEIPVYREADYSNPILPADTPISDVPVTDMAGKRADALRVVYETGYDNGPS